MKYSKAFIAGLTILLTACGGGGGGGSSSEPEQVVIDDIRPAPCHVATSYNTDVTDEGTTVYSLHGNDCNYITHIETINNYVVGTTGTNTSKWGVLNGHGEQVYSTVIQPSNSTVYLYDEDDYLCAWAQVLSHEMRVVIYGVKAPSGDFYPSCTGNDGVGITYDVNTPEHSGMLNTFKAEEQAAIKTMQSSQQLYPTIVL
ncbi:hypothetical protein VPHK479_0093 [Vibrio phage K479]